VERSIQCESCRPSLANDVVPTGGTPVTSQPDLRMQRIEAKTAVAVEVPRGAILRIIDIEGGQVADLVAFASSSRMEHFSQNCTRVNNWKMSVSVGDSLYSNRNAVMFTVVADAVGVHDTLFPSCSRYVYNTLFDGPPQDGCHELLTAALAPYEISGDLITDPLNVFMNTAIDTLGRPMIGPAQSEAGDAFELKAEMNCIVAVSACPDDRSDCNRGRCTAIGVEVQPPQ
jgi:uncharacterized protein